MDDDAFDYVAVDVDAFLPRMSAASASDPLLARAGRAQASTAPATSAAAGAPATALAGGSAPPGLLHGGWTGGAGSVGALATAVPAATAPTADFGAAAAALRARQPAPQSGPVQGDGGGGALGVEGVGTGGLGLGAGVVTRGPLVGPGPPSLLGPPAPTWPHPPGYPSGYPSAYPSGYPHPSPFPLGVLPGGPLGAGGGLSATAALARLMGGGGGAGLSNGVGGPTVPLPPTAASLAPHMPLPHSSSSSFGGATRAVVSAGAAVGPLGAPNGADGRPLSSLSQSSEPVQGRGGRPAGGVGVGARLATPPASGGGRLGGGGSGGVPVSPVHTGGARGALGHWGAATEPVGGGAGGYGEFRSAGACGEGGRVCGMAVCAGWVVA